MPPGSAIGATEARKLLGVSKDTLIRMAARGEITPLHKMPGPNGAYVFDRAEVERLVAKRGADMRGPGDAGRAHALQQKALHDERAAAQAAEAAS